MISGNCNRSLQYNTMGPPGGAQMYNPHVLMQQQQHPHVLFMAGGNVRTFPQMSRGFSMMPNRGGVASHPTVVQCSMQQGFGNSFGYHASAAPMFHQQHHIYQQPQVIHHQQQQQQQQQHQRHLHQPQPKAPYVPQHYIAPPPAASHNEPSSGFINGIKNMVKGIINPLNCDFYSDHHKYYNPKYRNNYMQDIKTDNMFHNSTPRIQRECYLKSEMNKPATKIEEKKPMQTQSQSQECTKTTPEVVAIFSSEDFPELPAPRRSRSTTPAKTETATSKSCDAEKEEAAPLRSHPPPKGTFFEIMCTTKPSGKRPTFGGRLKVVPPPFTLNASCRSRQVPASSSTSATNNDCDIEGDSFVIFSNNDKPGNCVFTSLNRPPRQRQISECSDDSFVVVFTDDADVDDNNDDDLEDDDDDDDDLDELDDSDDGISSEEEDSSDDEYEEHESIDVVDFCSLGRLNKTDKNNCESGTGGISLLCSLEISCNGVVPREHKQFDSGFTERKVTFDPQPVVHVMHAWNFAYRAARKGHWEDFARDRTRFQKRIERTSVYLNPVLTPEHREKIYRTRFCDDPSENQSQQCPSPKLNTSSHRRASTNHNNENQTLPKLTKLPDCVSF